MFSFRQKKPVAVIVASPSYEEMGEIAKNRIKDYAKMDVVVLKCDDKDGFRTKLNLDLEMGKRQVFYADADWWLLREWDILSMMGGPTMMGVQDAGVWAPKAFPHTDCTENGLDANRYFNTGMMFMDFTKSVHRDVLKVARQSWSDQQKGIRKLADATEQGHICRGVMEANCPQTFLPVVTNFYLFAVTCGWQPFIPRSIIGLHGAGIQPVNKLRRMKVQAEVFGDTYYPMQQSVLENDYLRTFELRK